MLSSLRNFFLALFISLLVFGVSAHFILKYVEASPGDSGPPTATGDSADGNGGDETNPGGEDGEPGEPADTSEFTALIMGIDSGLSQHDEKREADTIILLNINAKTRTLMISPLSCDMKTDVKGYTLRLGAVYGEFGEDGADTLVRTVWAYTGLMADYYCVLDYESIEQIFEILGEVRFDVPMDMFYDPYIDETTTEPVTEPPTLPNTTQETTKDYERIDLKSGIQEIDGEKAVQLFRYRDYSNGNFDRMAMQSDFIKETLKQKITFENLTNAREIYEQIKESVVETNMDARTFENYAETIFSLAEFKIRDVSYPGIPRNENGMTLFVPDVKSAVNRYNNYRKGVLDHLALDTDNIESTEETGETG